MTINKKNDVPNFGHSSKCNSVIVLRQCIGEPSCLSLAEKSQFLNQQECGTRTLHERARFPMALRNVNNIIFFRFLPLFSRNMCYLYLIRAYDCQVRPVRMAVQNGCYF